MLSGFNFGDFSSAAGLNLIGSAGVSADHHLRLMPAQSSIGGAWYTAEKSLVAGSFDTTFQFQLSTAGGGTDGSEGFAFVIQNSSTAALGGYNEFLGYEGIPNSIAVEFDTAQESGFGDPSASHIGVHTNGLGANGANESFRIGAAYNTSGFILDNAQVHTARINYVPGTLKIYLDNVGPAATPVLTVSVDLQTKLGLDAGRAWVGFTAAGGNSPLQQDILNWSLQAEDNVVMADKPTVVEGSVGTTTPATFTISRLGNLTGQTVVNWNTVNGTGVSGSDYIAGAGQVTFADGESQKTVAVTVNGDGSAEGQEAFQLALSTAAPYTLVSGQATILNDDTAISISDASAAEGDLAMKFADVFVASPNGELNDARGMDFGPDGNIYISGESGPLPGYVNRYDAQTGQLLETFASDPLLDGAKDVEFGPDGNLYVTNNISSSVLKFDGTTGASLGMFVTEGSGGLSIARGLVFGPDGNGDGHQDLYVTSASTDNVLRYDGLTGAFLGAFVASGSGGLNDPTALVFGPDGNLYVASGAHTEFNNRILRYNGSSGAFMNEFVSAGSGGLTLAPTGGLRFGPDTNGDGSSDLYVSNGEVDSVLVYSGSSGAFLNTFINSGLGGLDDPKGLLFDGSGNLLVLSAANNSVRRYVHGYQEVLNVTLSAPCGQAVSIQYASADGTARLADGDYVAASGTLTFQPGETSKAILVRVLDDTAAEPIETFTVNLSNPSAGTTIADGQGVATISANDEKFYVVNDASPDRTYEYGASGTAVENYTLTSGNSAPRGAASTAAGTTVWVVDVNKNVYLYNASGALQGSWAAGGLANNAQVEGIATNGTDVWLVDAKSDKVYKYTGAATRTSGGQSAASSFSLNSGNTGPKDIVTDGASLWVVNDSTTDKVFKYTLAGSLLGSWTIGSANSQPTGLTLDPASPSTIWIVDAGADKVFQYNNAAGLTSGSRTPDASWTLAAGNTNPQGIADPPVAGGHTADTAGATAVDAYFAWLGRQEEPAAEKRGRK